MVKNFLKSNPPDFKFYLDKLNNNNNNNNNNKKKKKKSPYGAMLILCPVFTALNNTKKKHRKN